MPSDSLAGKLVCPKPKQELSNFSPVAAIMACKLGFWENPSYGLMKLIELKINTWAVLSKYILSDRLNDFLSSTNIVYLLVKSQALSRH